MRFILTIFTFLSITFGVVNSFGQELVSHSNSRGKMWTYADYNIQGWKVYIEDKLLGQEALIDDLKTQLQNDLTNLVNIIPSSALKKIKQIPIWVSNEVNYPFRPGEKGTIPFHQSAEWLDSKNLNPKMEHGVHIINPYEVLYVHKIFSWGPMTLLHELSHGYHTLFLKDDYLPVLKAYRLALASGKYLQVPSRRNENILVKAYAATNVKEYFAEVTEAYFGINDWFPKTKLELSQYDPIGFGVVEEAWGITSN
ncbi:MAG: hypothetical protein HOO06_02700 [Bdellovibrionaceae bacterium]|jgi:hypothetical protein|nr:hypothetical protein [Pseudobdellovibrionaceae bacterium]